MGRPLLPALAIVAVAAFAAACGSSSTPTGSGTLPGSTGGPVSPAAIPSTPGEPTEADIAAAGGLIDAANLADDATIDAIDAVRFTPAGTLAASRRLAAGATGDALWAAVWVYVTLGTDPAPLLPLLTNDDPSIRSLAAAGAAAMGQLEGLDVLAALLGEDGGLRGAHPSVLVARYAVFSLSSLLADGPGDVPTGTPDERLAARAAWTTWLETNRSRLSFDKAQHAWRVS